MQIIITDIRFEYENGYNQAPSAVVVTFTSHNDHGRDFISGTIGLTMNEYIESLMSFESQIVYIKNKISEKILAEPKEEEPEA